MKYFLVFGLLTALNCSAVVFQNRTNDAGINMLHSANKMSTGIAVADFDNNGFQDLFYTGYDNDSALYFNAGDGTFAENPTLELPVMTGAKCGSVAAADFDNDGWQDIYVACLGDNYLLHNMQGSGFVNIIISSGTNHPERTEAVAWGDLNNDGWLDLVVGVHPTSFPANLNDPNDKDHIYLNNGDATFTNIQSSINSADIARATLALILSDVDFDGDLDIYLANDKNQDNVMLINQGSGCGGWCFSNQAEINGSEVPAFSMGIAVADYDNDGDWDMSYSSINEHIFLKNSGINGNLNFTDEAVGVGIGFDNGSGWGTLMFDADNDGWEDLFIATGFGTPTATNICYQNNQNGTFIDTTQSMGLTDTNHSQAVAWLDFNKDGLLDLSYGRYNGNYQLMENGSGTNNWVAIELLGGAAINRDAIGTKIFLEDGNGLKMIRELRAGESRGSNNQKLIHFGLGLSTAIDLDIIWPDGTLQQETSIPINQYIKLVYPPYDQLFADGFD